MNANLPIWLAFLALNEQATRDGLTGLYNRRYFDETLADHIEAATRYGRELSLVLFDLDRFKHINDTHGHAAGDEALRQFANLLKQTARKADIACRIGGDEFAVILPETNRTSAGIFAERVSQESEQSVSTGIAALPAKTLFAEADSDLMAKKTGCRQSPSR